MRNSQAYRLWAFWLVVMTSAYGCSTTGPITDSSPIPAPDPIAQASDEPPFREPDEPVRRGNHKPVVVVLQDQHRTYQELLYVFSAALGRPYQLLNLAHRSPESVHRSIAALAPVEVVALGHAALATTHGVAGLDVVYAGVLQPGEMNRGVDALPAFTNQLEYWLTLDPDIRRIGVIGSHSVQDRVDKLAVASTDLGIVLERRQVASDKELLLAFRSMVPHIDGFVFLPDDEVLSPTVIGQVMGHGKRNGVRMLVYSPLMFNLGASLFMRADPVAVASELIDLLNSPTKTSLDHRTVTRMRTKVRGVAHTDPRDPRTDPRDSPRTDPRDSPRTDPRDSPRTVALAEKSRVSDG